MVYTYKDGRDLVLVIKDANKVKDLDKVIGDIILRSTGEVPEAADDAPAEPVTAEKPVIPEVKDDKSFAEVSKVFNAGRYEGELRKVISSRLNSYIRTRFDNSLQDASARKSYVDGLSDNEIKLMTENFSSVIDKDSFKKGLVSTYGEQYSNRDVVDRLIQLFSYYKK